MLDQLLQQSGFPDARALAQVLLGLFQTEVWVEGKERVPQGPLLVVSNHRSFLDAPVLIAGLDRPIRFACHYYLSQVPLLREVALALGCIPLQQGSGPQLAFFRQAQATLAAGGGVGIFPEGAEQITRETSPQELGWFQPGFAHLALAAGVDPLPILPVAVWAQEEWRAMDIPMAFFRWFDPTEPRFQRPGGASGGDLPSGGGSSGIPSLGRGSRALYLPPGAAAANSGVDGSRSRTGALGVGKEMETLKGKPIASSPSRQKRPLLLYLPGMDGTGKLFYRQAQALQAEFHVRPLSLNHPAAGQSWESLADWVGSQLDEGAYLCGESFGACLALAVAAQQPERCRGLILVNPASSLRRRPWWWAGQVLLPFLPPGLYHQLAERGLGFLAELGQMEPPDRERLRQAVHSVSPEVAAHRLTLLGSFVVEELPLESMTLPTLLVAGGAGSSPALGAGGAASGGATAPGPGGDLAFERPCLPSGAADEPAALLAQARWGFCPATA